MKNALYIINGILLIAVGVLFYLFLTEKKNSSVIKSSTWIDTSKTPTRIAYFEWDSIENQKFYKDMQDELNRKNEEIGKKKLALSQQYQSRLDFYNKRNMSQVESEQAAQDMRNLEQNLRGEADKLDQSLNDYVVRKKVEFNDKIRNFLKEYNQNKKFSYIIANEPGFIFYRDSAFNITGDVVKGLNQIFAKKK
ncbi:MAG TPA: OmpH family outer membrane protein [Flavisolibacter sp.]|jgi:outer membrane protein|nr:OmpH family outer membrane protein [Flavisolibacter sp.]